MVVLTFYEIIAAIAINKCHQHTTDIVSNFNFSSTQFVLEKHEVLKFVIITLDTLYVQNCAMF